MIGKYMGRRECALVTLGIFLIICQVFFDLAIPEYMSRITDAYLLEDHDTVIQYGIEMVICAFASLALSLSTGFIMANFAASLGRKIREVQFDKVQGFAAQDLNRFSIASLVTRSTNDVTQIQNFVARGLQVCIKSPILAVWAVSKIYGSSMEWTMVVVCALLALVLVMAVSLWLAIPKFMNVQWLTDAVNRATRENLDGMRIIRAYDAEGFQESKFGRSNDNLLQNNLKAVKYIAFTWPFAQAAMNFVTLGIYWAGAAIILNAPTTVEQKLLFSDMIVFTSYATMVLSSVMVFIGIFRMLPRALVSMRRVREVVTTEPSVADGTETDGTEKGTVEFRDVSFAYPESNRSALEGITFRVEKGRTFAIIGTTGSGKTTIVNLIERFYDVTGGQVLVDGRDVREYELAALRRKLGYVPQSAVIFSGSVEMNVNYGHGSEDRTQEDIRRALRVAQAETFVDALPEGTGSHISQHGRNISGGQKQRVSIARAVCRDPEIYLLDDTFSALDYRTDRELRRALKEETSGSTVIIVAQRIGTIMDADEILVLDNGREVGRGRHRGLLRNCPEYLDIARSQLTEEELL